MVGFAGVLLILRPGEGLDPWGVTMVLVNVGFGTAYHILTRLLARTESTVAMLWHTALVGTLGFGIGAGFTPPLQPVTGQDAMLMAILVALATLGHFLFTTAYREAPTGLLAPVNYLHLVRAGGLGWLAFEHVPHPVAIADMTLVCSTGAWAALRQVG